MEKDQQVHLDQKVIVELRDFRDQKVRNLVLYCTLLIIWKERMLESFCSVL